MRTVWTAIRVVVVAVLVPIVAGLIVIDYVTPAMNTMGDAARATVLAAVVTVLGVIFSAAYGEISSYYKGVGASLEKKWDLIFPLVKKHYIPWINVAQVLEGSLKIARPTDADSVTLVLFHLMLFYGYRLRFILQDGGLILLSTPSDDAVVLQAYRTVEQSLDWAGDEVQTRLKVSYLQNAYVTTDEPDRPYVFEQFRADAKSDPELAGMHVLLTAWLTYTAKVEKARSALDSFQAMFKQKIDKLYSAW